MSIPNLPLLVCILIFLSLIIGVALFSQGQMESEEDFLVGGRNFNLWLTTFSLFATWFGAGTLISATDEIAAEGLRVSALEPYGAGICLILAALFFARPLWNMQLLTYSDFYRIKFGPKAEYITAILNVPVYVGWIAVQMIALAQILSVFFPLPVSVFVMIIAAIALFLTITGGILSVSLTDSFQLVIIIAGLLYLFVKLTTGWDGGLNALLAGVDPEHWVLIPSEKLAETFQWLSVFCISALGNITGQDLGQRMFSAKSAKVAQTGAMIAGLGYIVIGSLPVFFGLTASQTLGPNFEGSVMPLLIKNYLDPVSVVILTLTILSAILSTITSALLAPSSILAHNLLKRYFPEVSTLSLCRYAVVAVTAMSVAVSLMGTDVYSLLESSYAVGLVAFFAPLVIGLTTKKLNETSCIVAMVAGTLFWLPEFIAETFSSSANWLPGFVTSGEWPIALFATLVSFAAYFIDYELFRKKAA